MRQSEFTLHWGERLAALNHAFSLGDARAFDKALQAMHDTAVTVSLPVLADVVKVSGELYGALSRFRSDPRLAALAHQEIPDARLRLDRVLALTEDAAHKTLGLIEKSLPLADATVRSAKELLGSLHDRSHSDIRHFLHETRGNFEAVRSNLSEMMLAQSFQDLTGQILRGVQRLISEVETSLGELARLTGMQPKDAAPSSTGLEGPAVPGVTKNAVNAQSDVDELMAGLGI